VKILRNRTITKITFFVVQSVSISVIDPLPFGSIHDFVMQQEVVSIHSSSEIDQIRVFFIYVQNTPAVFEN
jgi:hypothetical protein